MVNLLASDSSLGVRAAAAQVAKRMKGTPSTNAERLRKKYRYLGAQGGLPRAITPVEQAVQRLRSIYRRSRTEVEEARAALPGAIQQAEDLGLEVRGKSASGLLRDLENSRDFLDLTTHDANYAFTSFMQSGITDEEQAASLLEKMLGERKLMERRIEAVQRIQNLGFAAGLPADFTIS